MKKWITGALAILLGVMSIAVPFSAMHISEAKTTEETTARALRTRCDKQRRKQTGN